MKKKTPMSRLAKVTAISLSVVAVVATGYGIYASDGSTLTGRADRIYTVIGDNDSSNSSRHPANGASANTGTARRNAANTPAATERATSSQTTTNRSTAHVYDRPINHDEQVLLEQLRNKLTLFDRDVRTYERNAQELSAGTCINDQSDRARFPFVISRIKLYEQAMLSAINLGTSTVSDRQRIFDAFMNTGVSATPGPDGVRHPYAYQNFDNLEDHTADASAIVSRIGYYCMTREQKNEKFPQLDSWQHDSFSVRFNAMQRAYSALWNYGFFNSYVPAN